MATISQEKRPSEIIQLQADFVNTLLTGEAIIGGNVSVTVRNILTDQNVTSTILFNTPTTVGSVVTFQVHNGTAGDTYELLIKTGTTTGANSYETTANLVITTSPATENPLTTRDEVRRQLRIDPADTSDDRLLDDLIGAASAYIRARTQRTFQVDIFEDVVYLCDGDDPIKMKLLNYPLLKVDRVKIYDEFNNLIWDITDSTTWDFVNEGYMWFINTNEFYFEPYRNVITYRAGYPKVPEDIRQACKELVIAFYRGVGREGLSSEKIGDYSYTKSLISSWPDALRREIDVPFVEGVIRRYTKHEFD